MMKELTRDILELIRRTSTDLPADVEIALKAARELEAGNSAAQGALDTILRNVEMSRQDSTPVCQDTGTPIFFVVMPASMSAGSVRGAIEEAVAEATRLSYLRPNAVNTMTDKNTGNNLGDQHFPVVHFQEGGGDGITMDLILKGGGCENVGAQFSLPDSRIRAGRDLDGVRRAVLTAVQSAQGLGCAPGVLGVAIGGDRGTGYEASKDVLRRRLDDVHPDPDLARLERQITGEANQLGIGPMGFGGQTTVLGTKITHVHRLPACYFVTVSYMCWAYRRRRMTVEGNQTFYF
jgi:fumarate hydratase, class I